METLLGPRLMQAWVLHSGLVTGLGSDLPLANWLVIRLEKSVVLQSAVLTGVSSVTTLARWSDGLKGNWWEKRMELRWESQLALHLGSVLVMLLGRAMADTQWH